MALADLTDWLNEQAAPDILWYVKRLSGNDTLATNSHQAGPYVPKDVLFDLFPGLNTREEKNPDIWFDLYIDSHADHQKVRAVYYNGKFFEDENGKRGTRNEARLTNFGGRASALLDPDSTGALTVFAFHRDSEGQVSACHVWVCRHVTEEEIIEDRTGPVDPGNWLIWSVGSGHVGDLFSSTSASSCRLSSDRIPPDWLDNFPTGEQIIRKAVELRPDSGLDPDERLIRRRVCEYEIFQSVEEAVHLPRIRQGFDGIDAFVRLAQSILQSRKSRSGKSLELHAREIFVEEGLRSETDFKHSPVVNGKRPDFLFPSQDAYENPSFPADRLRMLAAKTTCKDRWRQILNEADRIPEKHLLTLQEGVSEAQFREMREAGVRLVAPTGIHDSYPKTVRPHLISFESFIGDIRLIAMKGAQP